MTDFYEDDEPVADVQADFDQGEKSTTHYLHVPHTPRRAMGVSCWAHKHRELVPIEVHHCWPLGAHGPNVKENRWPICSNAHGAVHDLLNKMLKAGTVDLPWVVRRNYGRKVRRLAVAGFKAIKSQTIVQP